MAKAELHLHLEGTVDRDTVRELDSEVTKEQLDEVWNYSDFEGFIQCFKFVALRLQTPDDYATITRRMMQKLSTEGVAYAEVTLAAGVILWRGLPFTEIWRAIRAAQKSTFSESPVELWWNLDAVRQFGPDHVMETAKLSAGCAGDGAISFGIGGDELRGPAREFEAAYRYAQDAGLRLTAHAGETDGPESIRDALRIGAERIGHGIRAVDDPDLMRLLRDKQIPLEVCISSNVKTGAVRSLETHPVRRLWEAGVPLTLNTDDPGIFDCSLGGEFEIARTKFGFSESELQEIAENAWRFRFAAGATTST